MRRSSLILIGCVVLAPMGASADKQTAKQSKAKAHIAKAMKAHAKNNFTVALGELQAAYALDAQPDLLYAIGQVYVKLDRCGEAITTYQAYLATKPAPQAAADTEQAIATCKAKLDTPPPAAVVAPEPPPPEPTPPPPPPPPRRAEVRQSPPRRPVSRPAVVIAQPARSPWYKDTIGDALVITGAASTVIGAFMYAGARSDLDDAEATKNISAYRDLVDDAKSKHRYSVVFLAGGGVFIALGIARYATRGPSAKEETRVGLVPADGGGLVTWSGGF
jgi:hypothetical protein